MQAGYKKALHQFFLKVHPDFFAKNRHWQLNNERSVAQLNELLEWGKSFKRGNFYAPPATEMRIKFHLKLEEDGKGGGEVESVFKLPRPFHLSASYKAMAERSINSFLRDLLQKCSCIDHASSSVPPLEQAPEQYEASRKPAHTPLEANPVKTLMEETSETLSETWQRQRIPAVDDLIDADFVLFDRSLSPRECSYALETLREKLPQMQYEKWYETPIMFGRQYALGEFVHGVVSVPWNFQLRDFVKFIDENRETILEAKQALEDIGKRIEQNITQLCYACDLDDILISCGHTRSLAALEVLNGNTYVLNSTGLEKMCIEIGEFFGFRKNGVLIVPHDVNNASLIAFLEKLRSTNQLSALRQKYGAAKTMIDQTSSLLREFRETVKPKGIDAFTMDCTYSQRLAWAKELQHNAARIAVYDWTAFTFILGPLDVSWTEKFVALPWNFDGETFVKYIDSVNQSAKEQNYAEHVAEEEAMKKHQAETVSGAREQERDFEAPSTGTQPQSTAHEGQLSVPSVEKHIAAQYVVSHGTDDAIHTESPIQSHTTFQSDVEAAETLDWEGFHRDPVAMGKEAMQITEDQQKAFYLLQRSKQEKIMRELLEEQRNSRRGNSARRKTFGYFTGITDDKLPMKRANVKPKGTGAVSPPTGS
ncbi:RhoGEF domain-containing protein [Perkinsela sp. CCAP 1560/4]|nr:RhoGEF domain-containing protein [Perkinsela sp. CCAP 1560/4]|eukprot:KNH06369.1 RhoGEF domain-containing protein [Perkinsela sp. CCAP 1560/4]